MLRPAESRLKFLVKMGVVAPLRALFLFFKKIPVNTLGWEKRLLLVNLEGMGDLVMFTSVLKHYRKAFPACEIYLLIKSGLGIETLLSEYFVDHVLTLRYRRFAVNPFYGASFVNRLRRIGFSKVINHDFSAAEIMGKTIAVLVGARDVVGYEGQGIEFEKPFDIQQEKNLHIVRRRIFPRYTKLIPRIRRDAVAEGRLPNEIEYYRVIYEAATGRKEREYVPALGSRPSGGNEKILEKFGLKKNRYIIVNVNSSVRCKCWPLDRFSRIVKYLSEEGYEIVLIGSRREAPFVAEFERMCPVPMVNAVGKTSFEELLDLTAHCLMVVTNDTSTVHIAVALKKPSVCIVGGGQFGVAVEYGYRDINRWAYSRTACFLDNWRCSRRVPPGEPSPCVDAVSAEAVEEKLRSLIDYLRRTPEAPRDLFAIEFDANHGNRAPAGDGREKRHLKVIYAGIRAENYDALKQPSFEYVNFYETLRGMPDVAVIEHPYDSILEIGKQAFNERLFEAVRRERPDLFFAFMFSDEFDPNVLDRIRDYTTSVAWFADDHWRLDNYSRRWALHFTWSVTTWSKGSDAYRRYNITNVIRSQWACNTRLLGPADVPRTIDVSFVGSRTPARARIIGALRAAGINVFVRGWGWPEGRVGRDEVIRIFSESKINLNLNAPPSLCELKSLGRVFLRRSRQRIVPDVLHLKDNIALWRNLAIPQIKARPFEILGCRAFLISGEADDIRSYYAADKEIVYYDGRADDLIRKIRSWLPREREREKIARAGYERTLREHTYEKRFSDVLRKAGLAVSYRQL